MHVLVAAEPVEHLPEERVAVAVVERHLRRRSHDGKHARGIDAVEDGRIGLEAGQVVLLLDPRVLTQLGRLCAKPGEAVGRNGVGEDHPCCRPESELVLRRRELVVVRGRGGDPEAPRDEHRLMGAVREREVEPSPLREAAERREPRGHRPRLPQRAGASVCGPDDAVRDPAQLEQLEGLRVVARGHLDVVTVLGEQPQQRPEKRHVR